MERLLEAGPESLSDAELLAIILRCGTARMNAVDLAQRILNAHPVYPGINGLNYLSPDELMQISGVGKVKASQILALAELSKRMAGKKFKETLSFRNPETIADYFMEKVRYLTKERVYAVFLSTDLTILKEVMLSEGSVRCSLVSPRELFIDALRYGAVSIVLVHNHPSGNPEPSEEDLSVTERIARTGALLGINLLDHIIIGDKRYISLMERGSIPQIG